MEGLTQGRVVHYVLDMDRDGVQFGVHGEHRAAFVLNVKDHDSGVVNLAIFHDGYDDLPVATRPAGGANQPVPPMWATDRRYDEQKSPGTWHWIERV